MATVNNTTNGISADLLASVNGTKSTQKSAVQEQETKFLTLLMTQMKNQDPLNPMDNAQVTTQLALLNMASGIEKLNAAFGQLLSGYNDSMSMQSAAMIGKNVLVAGNNLPLSKGQAVAGAKLEADAGAGAGRVRRRRHQRHRLRCALGDQPRRPGDRDVTELRLRSRRAAA